MMFVLYIIHILATFQHDLIFSYNHDGVDDMSVCLNIVSYSYKPKYKAIIV